MSQEDKYGLWMLISGVLIVLGFISAKIHVLAPIGVYVLCIMSLTIAKRHSNE